MNDKAMNRSGTSRQGKKTGTQKPLKIKKAVFVRTSVRTFFCVPNHEPLVLVTAKNTPDGLICPCCW
jgi:hypothetical protein